MATNQNIRIKKSGGFYTGFFAALLSVVAAIMYGINFSSVSYKEPIFDITICIILGISALVSLSMLFIHKLDGFAPVLLCASNGIAFLMYIKMMIWPISDTIYGIEPFPYMRQLIICALLLFLGFVFSEISLYMKKTKEIILN